MIRIENHVYREVGIPADHKPPDPRAPRPKHPGHCKEKNSRWSGGWIVRNKATYVLCPDHPKADVNGYVLEGILVLESLLGRYMWSFERVKFADGDRCNAYPDNLLYRKMVRDPRFARRKKLPKEMSKKFRRPSTRLRFPKQLYAEQVTRTSRRGRWVREVSVKCKCCGNLYWQQLKTDLINYDQLCPMCP